MKPIISIIAAIQRNNNGLGYKNELLYRISDDLKRFKNLTTGHPIIMGRKTFDSIGRALPNRTNIAITRDTEWNKEGIVVAHSLEEAIDAGKKSEGNEEIFIIGGGEIYKQALPFTKKLYLTIIDGNKEADIFFPDYSEFINELSHEEKIDETSGINYIYSILTK